ncbi:MAG: phosphoenolpyruvate carboxylase, partial [Microcystis aeruginosa]
MSVLVPSTETEQDIFSTSNLFLQQRLKLIEDLWKEVLISECGQELVDLLELLRHLCSEEGQVTDDSAEATIAKMIEDLELGEAIKVTRAFALYFQLINIIEQHYEQRDQQLLRRTVIGEENESPKTDPPQKSILDTIVGADWLEKTLNGSDNSTPKSGLFHWLFPYLKQVNVPPQEIQRLLDQLDIRLVFTAHPTEIVRHTIRIKQRRISGILEKLDQAEEIFRSMGLTNSREA